MPRKARNLSNAPYYHVMVQGINKESIFFNDNFKKTYLRILQKYLAEYQIQMIAYCIMKNHAHLLLKPSKITDLTQCMHQTNLTFAISYNQELNRVGYVFRNRFETQEIYNNYYLYNCIKYIHMNPIKAKFSKNQSDYIFSSYNNYCNKTGFVTSNLIKEIFPNENEYLKILNNTLPEIQFLDESLDIVETKKWIDEYLKNRNLNFKMLKNNKELLHQTIYDIKNNCNIQNKDIADILEVHKSSISRALKKYSS